MRQVDTLQSLQIRCVALSMLFGIGSLVASRFELPLVTRVAFYGFLACVCTILLLGALVWRLQRIANNEAKKNGDANDE